MIFTKQVTLKQYAGANENRSWLRSTGKKTSYKLLSDDGAKIMLTVREDPIKTYGSTYCRVENTKGVQAQLIVSANTVAPLQRSYSKSDIGLCCLFLQ